MSKLIDFLKESAKYNSEHLAFNLNEAWKIGKKGK